MATQQVGDYTVLMSERLGQGTFGTVYKAQDSTNTQVAVKHSRCGKKYVTEANHEANLLREIKPHKNIITVLDLIAVDVVDGFGMAYVDIYMFMDFCSMGDLSILATQCALTFEQKANIMLQCCTAIHHLHNQKPVVIHRDIKPNNILVSGPSTSPTFRLADFGISRLFDRIPEFAQRTMTAGMGTCPFMAPELFSNKPKYNEKVDTYSGGVSFLSVLLSEKGKGIKKPEAGGMELGRYLHDKGEIEVPEAQDKPGDAKPVRQVKMIIREMIELEPQSRPDAKEILDRFTRLCAPHTRVWERLDGYGQQGERATGVSSSGAAASRASKSIGSASRASASIGSASRASASRASRASPSDASESSASRASAFSGSASRPSASRASASDVVESSASRGSLSGASASDAVESSASRGSASRGSVFGASAWRGSASGVSASRSRAASDAVVSPPASGAAASRSRASRASMSDADGLASSAPRAAAGRSSATAPSRMVRTQQPQPDPAPVTPAKSRDGAATAAEPGGLRVQKVSSTVLPVQGEAFVHFGEGNFLAAYKDDDALHFYEYADNQYNLTWKKKNTPEGIVFDSYKHVSPSKEIYCSLKSNEVSVFDGDLEPKKKRKSPGMMIGLLAGGKLAVMTDHASYGSSSSPVKVSVAPVGMLQVPVNRLGVPMEGAYTREDTLVACGRLDGSVAIVSLKKPFVDIYGNSGRFVARTALPSGAGRPGCSSKHILIPLWKMPSICVVSWQGVLLHTLGPRELGVGAGVQGYGVSSPWGQRFSFFAVSSSDRIVHTYEVTEKK